MSHHAIQRNQFDEHAVEQLEWNDSMLLGHGSIDDSHKEFVTVVKALAGSNVGNALDCLQAVEDHLVAHFETELHWMKKTDYPSMNCHLDEHQKVLDTVRSVNQFAQVGHVGLRDVHRLAATLADWFSKHATYLDSALSAWISKRMHGGAPVILRRDLGVNLVQQGAFA